MGKDYLLKIVLGVYGVTKFFPEKEPLKFVLREKANQILADAFLFFSQNPIGLGMDQKKDLAGRIISNVEIIKGYFEIAEKQNWLAGKNFFVLKREYDRIKELAENFFRQKKLFQEERKEKREKEGFFENGGTERLVNRRAQKIIEILRKREKAQIKDFKEFFPKISKRTLRRDMDYLLEKRLIKRIGDSSNTFYRLGGGNS